MSTLRPAKSSSIPKGNTEGGIISIINSKNGKRLSLSAELLSQLGMPEKVQVSFNDTSLIIGEVIPDSDENDFFIKKSGAKGMVYAGLLVNEICEAFNLDFSERTSLTFHEVEYRLAGDYVLAIIKIG